MLAGQVSTKRALRARSAVGCLLTDGLGPQGLLAFDGCTLQLRRVAPDMDTQDIPRYEPLHQCHHLEHVLESEKRTLGRV